MCIFNKIGGIIGLGEAEADRVGLLHTLATLPVHPESVPINALIAVKGTPLQDQKVLYNSPCQLCFFFSPYCCLTALFDATFATNFLCINLYIVILDRSWLALSS